MSLIVIAKIRISEELETPVDWRRKRGKARAQRHEKR